ncbi:hypothetical protein UPYG_G00276620 [Umbra pygmaea]|uniref:Uncharacterized protein n=1 Tax=Umbra pygmaea TaxID=75934 RepID=A0ABD0W2C9_UMBPY
MAHSTKGDRHSSGKSKCQCKSQQKDDDDVFMHDPECSLLEQGSSASSEEYSEKAKNMCSADPEVLSTADTELECRLEEIRMKNKCLLKRFEEVEEDRKRAEQRGSALARNSTKLVKTCSSAHSTTTPGSWDWERLSITVKNQSKRSRRQPKAQRMEDRLERWDREENPVAQETKQMIVCTIDNSQDAGRPYSDHMVSTSDEERREYLRWKRRYDRLTVGKRNKLEEDLSVRLQKSREQRRSAW